MMSFSQAWLNFNWYLAIGIFFAYLVLDILSVYYTLFVMRYRSIASANIVVALYIISAFGVINYVQNYLYIISVALGAWVGTYISVEWEKRKDGHGVRHKKVGL